MPSVQVLYTSLYLNNAVFGEVEIPLSIEDPDIWANFIATCLRRLGIPPNHGDQWQGIPSKIP